eukprot:75282_1
MAQSDLSDDTGDEIDDYGYEMKDDRQEYGDKLLAQNPSNHFLFKQKNFMSWYTDDVSLRHTQNLINTLKSKYLDCEKEHRIGNNRYIEIGAGRGHVISALSSYFKHTTIFECSERFTDALNQRLPSHKYKSNNIRVIEDKLFDYFAPKQDLLPQEYHDGFDLIILHHILNTVNLQKWNILLKYMLEILSINGLLIITSSLSSGTLINIVKKYIPNYRTNEYILEYFRNSNEIVVESWEDITSLVYTESRAISVYLEILETCFAIYDNKLFNMVKFELKETLKNDLKSDGFYSDNKDDKTDEYMVTVQFNDVHIAVRKN